MTQKATSIIFVLALLPLVAVLSGMALTPALIALVMAVCVTVGLARFRPWPAHRDLIIILGLLLLWPLVSSGWSITRLHSSITTVRLLLLMGLGALGLALIARLHISVARGLVAFAACLGLCTVLLIWERVPGGGLIRLFYEAFDLSYADFIDKNVNRGLCALAVLVWPAVAGLHRLGYRRAAYALPFIVALAVLRLDSLSATLAVVLGIAAFFLMVRFSSQLPKIIAVAVPLFVLGWPALFYALDGPVFSNATVYEALPSTAQHRVEIWRFALEKFAEQPVMGWGLDTSRAMPGGDVVYGQGRTYLPLHPHNSAIQILLEEGLIGFVLSVAALALVMRRWRAMPGLDAVQRASSGAAMIAYLIVGFSAFSVWQYWWVATGWIAAMVWTMSVKAAPVAPSAAA